MEQRQEPTMEIINFTEDYNNSDKISFSGHFFGLNRYSAEQSLNNRIAIVVISAILCFTTALGNTAFLITIRKTSLHSVAKLLMTSLAVSDLAVGLVINPLFIATMLNSDRAAAAILVKVLGPFLEMVSLFTITAIGVDRLLALQLHLRYEAVVTSSRVTLVVVFIWVFFGICSCTVMILSLKICLIAFPAVFISLLAVNFVVYLKIYLIVRRHQRQIQQQQPQANNENIFSVKRFKKSAINTFLVFILLLCCYLPYSVCVNMDISGASISRSVFITTVTLVHLNSSLNPVLYCWRDHEIRTAMKQLFRYR